MGWMFRSSALALGLLFVVAPVAVLAQTVENSSEVRFQLDLKVPNAALGGVPASRLEPQRGDDGRGQGCQLARRVHRSDHDQCAGWAGDRDETVGVPGRAVKEPGGTNVQLVIGGLTEDEGNAPGPFGNYLQATTHNMRRTVSNETGGLVEEQDWDFSADSGEHLALNVVFERGVANRGCRPTPCSTRPRTRVFSKSRTRSKSWTF